MKFVIKLICDVIKLICDIVVIWSEIVPHLNPDSVFIIENQASDKA